MEFAHCDKLVADLFPLADRAANVARDEARLIADGTAARVHQVQDHDVCALQFEAHFLSAFKEVARVHGVIREAHCHPRHSDGVLPDLPPLQVPQAMHKFSTSFVPPFASGMM